MNRQQGFSLLEILVAFSIMALALGILLRIFSSGVQTASLAETYSRSVQIAESLMAEVTVKKELSLGESSGVIEDEYHWSVQISPFNWLDETNDSQKYSLYKIVVTVYRQGEENRPVELNTLKMVPVAL